MPKVRVAIAHDYLTQRGGAERVVLSLLKAFPGTPVYTTLYEPDGTYPEFRDVRVITSALNHVAAFRHDHRRALPLLASAASSLHIDADVVIASSSAFALGFPTTGRKVVYCHSPARFLYLTDEYLGHPAARSAKGLALLAMRPALIRWDQRAAKSADVFLCNSTVVRERIGRIYGREAEVLPPPSGVVPDGPASAPDVLADWSGGFHLVVSRLLPYKNVDAVIEAFRDLGERLVVIGKGPEQERLTALAPPNVRLAQGLTDEEMRWAYRNAKALVAPAYEDFGLTPLEAGSFGIPVIALHGGGYLDTVVEGVNGTWFEAATPHDIADAVRRHAARTFDPEAIRAHADRFCEDRFITRLREVVNSVTEEAGAHLGNGE